MIEDHLEKFSLGQTTANSKMSTHRYRACSDRVCKDQRRRNESHSLSRKQLSDLPETSSVRDDQEMEHPIILLRLSPSTLQNTGG
jgi:hypothetical protein